MYVGAADPCGPQPAAWYHTPIHGTASDQRAAEVCGPYAGYRRAKQYTNRQN